MIPEPWYSRSIMTRAIRDFFDQRGFQEVQTPVLVEMPGTEKYLRYFESSWLDSQGKDNRKWLRSSPEIHLKKLMCSGLKKIWELGPCFRNGGEWSPWHHPEFSMLEWYVEDFDDRQLLAQTQDLVKHCHSVLSEKGLSGRQIPSEIEVLTVSEAFEVFAKIKLHDEDPELGPMASALSLGSVRQSDDFETAFFKLLIEVIEPALAKQAWVALRDWPASQAALAKVEGGVSKRVETYLFGVEISNGFHELVNPALNLSRVRESNNVRQNLNFEVPQEDQEFFECLHSGMTPCSGNALGFDRLLAVLRGFDNIEEVIPFRNGSYSKNSDL